MASERAEWWGDTPIPSAPQWAQPGCPQGQSLPSKGASIPGNLPPPTVCTTESSGDRSSASLDPSGLSWMTGSPEPCTAQERPVGGSHRSSESLRARRTEKGREQKGGKGDPRGPELALEKGQRSPLAAQAEREQQWRTEQVQHGVQRAARKQHPCTALGPGAPLKPFEQTLPFLIFQQRPESHPWRGQFVVP